MLEPGHLSESATQAAPVVLKDSRHSLSTRLRINFLRPQGNEAERFHGNDV